MTRGLLIAAAVGLCVPALGARLQAPAEKDAPPALAVAVDRGTYSVTARFDVPEPPRRAMAVLTDYEEIPRFMPGVRTSVVLARTSRHVTIEQEAISEYMMFSKNIHLVLEVSEDGDTLRFVDRAHDSFMAYEGTWRVTPADGGAGGATVTYSVTARPAFDVPGFILKRLLRRDSRQMVESLRREISRANGEESR